MFSPHSIISFYSSVLNIKAQGMSFSVVLINNRHIPPFCHFCRNAFFFLPVNCGKKDLNLVFIVFFDIIGGEKQIAENMIDFCNQLSFFIAHKHIVVSEQENIGVVEEGSAVQMPSEYRIVNCIRR